MDLSGASNCSTFSECARGNDAANILNVNLASQSYLNTIKIKEERDISDKQVKNDNINLQSHLIENVWIKTNFAEDKCQLPFNANIKKEAPDFSSNLHQVDCSSALTNDKVIKCEELSEEEEELGNVTGSYICDENLKERSDCQFRDSTQSKSEVDVTNINEPQDGLIVKSELECSDGEETQDHVDSNGGQFCLDISEGEEKQKPLQDFQDQSKLFSQLRKFATRSKPISKIHKQAVHLKSEHETICESESSLYRCQICDRVFKTKGYRDRHVKMHDNKEINLKGLFECEVCKKEFSRKILYLNHKSIHFKAKPYKCTHCKKKFATKMYCYQHFRLQHKDVIFPCNQCEESFASKQALTDHIKSHFDLCVFMCDICSKCFRTKSELKCHIIIHTDAKPFVCKVCNKSFKLSGYLFNHSRLHSDAKPFQCQQCDKTFKYKSNLCTHNRKVHSNVRPVAWDKQGFREGLAGVSKYQPLFFP